VDDANDTVSNAIPLGRVLVTLDAVRVLQHAGVDPDDVVRRHRAGRLPGESDGGRRVSRCRVQDRDGDVVEIVVSTTPAEDRQPATIVALGWD
jgi:hypothetical protein